MTEAGWLACTDPYPMLDHLLSQFGTIPSAIDYAFTL